MRRSALIFIIVFILMAFGLIKNERIMGNDMEDKIEVTSINIDTSEQFQTIESFGASGAWWSQDVGGWTEKENDEQTKRDFIAQMLFDSLNGIGLTSYRYNLGAGSTRENSPKITDPWRRAESFEVEAGVYDWNKDENAQWFLKQAVDYGIEDIYLFVNSPLTRLTETGAAYGKTDLLGQNVVNLKPENYKEFATYVLDVTEHFLEEGIPVTHISPINEPQWEWAGGQEGIHYEADEMVQLIEVFVDELDSRPQLSNVSLSMPELGEWSNSSVPYFDRMLESDIIMSRFDTWDIHSYWSDSYAKYDFVRWMEENNVDISLKTTEWTEMVNGRDNSMDSALTLANEIYEDLTILNVEGWQYWIAVSSYDYRDGLIYVDLDDKEITLTKRLWTMGNFSKFIKPGYIRVSNSLNESNLSSVSFVGEGEFGEELITVIINKSQEDKSIHLDGIDYTNQIAYVTDANNDLEEYDHSNLQQINIPSQSIVTIRSFN